MDYEDHKPPGQLSSTPPPDDLMNGANSPSKSSSSILIANFSKSLSSIFSELSKLDEDVFPPVEDWNPPLCKNVHMKIDRSGKWYFMNSPIGRQRMVNLFSRVLRLDKEGYFLD